MILIVLILNAHRLHSLPGLVICLSPKGNKDYQTAFEGTELKD